MISVALTVTVTNTVTGEQDAASADFVVESAKEANALERVPGLWSPGAVTPGVKRDRPAA